MLEPSTQSSRRATLKGFCVSVILMAGCWLVAVRPSFAQAVPQPAAVQAAPTMATAQQFGSHAPPTIATGAQRLLIEQVEQLAQSNQVTEAIATLEKLFEQSDGNLIEADAIQRAGTLAAQRYTPVRRWVNDRLAKLLIQHPEARQSYLKNHEAAAQAALADAANSKDLARTRQSAQRFALSTSGHPLQLLLADLYLEMGWGYAATQIVNQQLPCMRYPLKPNAASGLNWQIVAQQLTDDELRRAAAQWYEQLSQQAWQSDTPEQLAFDLLQRTVDAALVSMPREEDRNQLLRYTTALADTLPVDFKNRFQERLNKARSWQPLKAPDANEWNTYSGSVTRNRAINTRFDPDGWPTWNQQLERYSGSSDRVAASKPRVAESENGLLSYHPVVHRGRVYVNELNRITAYDLENGSAWPSTKPPLPLFDSHIAPAALLPLGYPLVGAPRGTLTVHDDCLYARMGSPVTGWANGEKAGDGGSIGYIIGLDLQRQGSLMRGFPLHLSQFDFGGSEPEGCPLVSGDKLIVTVAKRDNVGLRRSVAAFDRFSGELLWKSPVLATGTIEGAERANLISHQLLSIAGGRIFYNTNLGVIACLDITTGQIEWLTRYRRHERDKQPFSLPDRFRYRDLTPTLVHSGMIYCAPQDCAELFALDAATGDLIWATPDTTAADAVHIVGISGDNLIASGDRLLWLNLATGQIRCQFPSAGTGGNLNALPSPRGLGRGLISGDEIYWPTANEIIVFSAAIPNANSVDIPPMTRRIRLDTRGSEGGNLVAADGWLLIATPSRLMAFAPAPKAKQ